MLLFSHPHIDNLSCSELLLQPYLAFLGFCVSCHSLRRDILFCYRMTEDTILQTSTANGSWSSAGDPQAKCLSLTSSNPFVRVRAKSKGQMEMSSLWSAFTASARKQKGTK